jgi:hypothetical protein
MTQTKKNTERHRDRPEVQIGTIWITTSWIGAVLSLGMGFMVYEALPETRMFLWGALGFGVVIGLATLVQTSLA